MTWARARAILVVGLAAVLVAGCGVADTASGSAAGKPDRIPWPAHPTPVTRVAKPDVDPDLPVCTAGQLTAKGVSYGPAMGTLYLVLRVTNAGRECQVDASDFSVAGGARTRADSYATDVVAGRARYRLAVSQACLRSGANTRGGLGVDYRGRLIGRGPDAPAFKASEDCAALSFNAVDPRMPPPEYPQIDVTAVGPAPSRAGRTIDATIELRNRSRRPFRFDRCPSFTETFSQYPRVVHQSYRLPCRAIGTLAAGAAVRLEAKMTFRRPVRGHYKVLDWQLGDEGPSDGWEGVVLR